MTIKNYLGYRPQIGENVFVADNTTIIGQVSIGDNSSIWYGAVLRGDIDRIVIGKNTSIQDNCTIHIDSELPAIIGNNVTVGHNAVIHAAKIEDNCLIGMNSTILDEAVIGHGSVVAAGALVAPGMIIPPYSQVMGVPARVVKQLDETREQELIDHAAHYVAIAKEYMKSTNDILNKASEYLSKAKDYFAD